MPRSQGLATKNTFPSPSPARARHAGIPLRRYASANGHTEFAKHRLAGADQVEKTADQYGDGVDDHDDGHPGGNGQQNASGAGCICSSLIPGAILQL